MIIVGLGKIPLTRVRDHEPYFKPLKLYFSMKVGLKPLDELCLLTSTYMDESYYVLPLFPNVFPTKNIWSD